MTNSYKYLRNRLESFINRYYMVKLLRGLILSALVWLSYFLIIYIIESQLYSSVSFRTVLFFFTLTFTLVIFILWILFPLLKVLKYGRDIDYKKANWIINNHFPELKDQLINVVELAEDKNASNNELVLASINQKISKIEHIPFAKAIDFSSIKKFGLYLGIVLFMLLTFAFVNPSSFKNTYERLVNYSDAYYPPPPFEFQLVNTDLSVRRGDSYTINLQCVGDEIPSIVYIRINNVDYLMEKSNNNFEYTFENVNNNLDFRFTDKTYFSDNYLLNVLSSPIIDKISIQINPPSYTKLDTEILNENSDVIVPVNSTIKWTLSTLNTSTLKFKFADTTYVVEKDGDKFSFSMRANDNREYSIICDNEYFKDETLLSSSISVIPDEFPLISVKQYADTSEYGVFYFSGEVSDDYGFHSLKMIIKSNTSDADSVVKIDVPLRMNHEYFEYGFNFNTLAFSDLSYYFEIADNDYFHGYKKATTSPFSYKKPTKEEILKESDKKYDEIFDMLNETGDLSQNMQEKLDELDKSLLNSKNNKWDNQQISKSLQNQHQSVKDMFEQLKNMFQENSNMLNTFTKQSEDIKIKQEEIDKLLNDLMQDKELQDLLKKLQELSQQDNPNNFKETVDELNHKLESLEKQMNNSIEMLKRLQVEQQLDNVLNEMEQLANDEHQMLKDADKLSENKLLEKQLQNKSTLEKLKQDYEKAKEQNEQLENKYDLDDVSQEMKDILNQMDKNADDLRKKDKKGAKQGMKSSSEKLSQLSQKMKDKIQSQIEMQQAEDINNLKRILNNLVSLSLDQETVNQSTIGLNVMTQPFSGLIIDQTSIQNQSMLVSDSLNAIIVRNPSVSSFIKTDLEDMEYFSRKSVSSMKDALQVDSRGNSVRSYDVMQRKNLTSINNLALFLAESINNLENQSNNSKSGDGECTNPGGAKPNPFGKMQDGQQSLKQQMQNMIKDMKNGKKPGQMSDQMGQALMMNEMLQQMIQDMKKQGGMKPGTQGDLNEINKMLEENRIDILNQNISQRTLDRQNDILDKMLESEKADKERDLDNERESNSADKQFYSNPALTQQERDNIKFKEQLIKNQSRLNSFYRDIYKRYVTDDAE
ncbi:MAG: DUF4175 family protein [Bacteroidales bacterium]